jgi:hypothetical protein
MLYALCYFYKGRRIYVITQFNLREIDNPHSASILTRSTLAVVRKIAEIGRGGSG